MEDSKRQVKPLLTIVIPFFNQKELVGEMFRSIQANDFQDWELLAVDDGSTPDTIDYIRTFETDRRIHIIPREITPKGAPTCRNIGLQQAKGNYLIFFDSDDYITPSCLRERIDAIERHPEFDFMVFPSGELIDGRIAATGSNLYGYPIYRKDLPAFLRRTLPFVVVNNIYRTRSLRDHAIMWDTQLLSFQDSDFNIQALLHGLKYDYAQTAPDYGYRIIGNSNSISKKITSERHRQSHLHFLDKQWDEVQRHYGKKYNYSLYLCALYIAFFTMSHGLEKNYSRQLADIVHNHSRSYGFIFKSQMNIGLFAGHFMPGKTAVRLICFGFLLRRKWLEYIVPKRIRKIHEKA